MALSMQHEDRRAKGVRRVPVERIVDVCGALGGKDAAAGSGFQGWSVNVSGRGMSVRATHLPELHAPLIVRFQEHGSEVIAEGEVTWRKETPNGAEFGVRFTALDSGSVQALKAICQSELPSLALDSQEEPPAEEEHDTEPVPPTVPSLKLHIDGLAAPMQARVRQHGPQRVALGSQLTFLRVGGNVEVEDSELGNRRRARIDEVDVTVDPDSQVPELIVALRYDTPVPRPVSGERARSPRLPTSRERIMPPRPSKRPKVVVDADALQAQGPQPAWPVRDEPARGIHGNTAIDRDDLTEWGQPKSERAALADRDADRPHADTARAGAAAQASRQADGERDVDLDLDLDPLEDGDTAEDERARERLLGPSLELEEPGLVSDAERLRQRLNGVLGNLSSAARLARVRCLRLGEAASRSAGWVLVQARNAGRSALAAPRVSLPRRRTSAAPRASLRASAIRAQRLPGVPGGAASALFRRNPRRAAFASAVIGTVALATWLGRGPSGAEAQRPLTPAAQVVPAAAEAAPASDPPTDDAPSPGQRPRLLLPADDRQPREDGESRAVARVSPTGSSSLIRGTEPKATASLEKRALARVEVTENAFDAPATPTSRKKAGTTEFGSGRLLLPLLHRLRLDQPGASLRGERTPTGFDVFIPGRRILESGTAIAKRDPGIAKVSTTNSSDGTRVSFRFRDGIPAYKVRLRNDYVEFLINSN
jgi:hypothetical protein